MTTKKIASMQGVVFQNITLTHLKYHMDEQRFTMSRSTINRITIPLIMIITIFMGLANLIKYYELTKNIESNLSYWDGSPSLRDEYIEKSNIALSTGMKSFFNGIINLVAYLYIYKKYSKSFTENKGASRILDWLFLIFAGIADGFAKIRPHGFFPLAHQICNTTDIIVILAGSGMLSYLLGDLYEALVYLPKIIACYTIVMNLWGFRKLENIAFTKVEELFNSNDLKKLPNYVRRWELTLTMYSSGNLTTLFWD